MFSVNPMSANLLSSFNFLMEMMLTINPITGETTAKRRKIATKMPVLSIFSMKYKTMNEAIEITDKIIPDDLITM